jgi:hypothetical protein
MNKGRLILVLEQMISELLENEESYDRTINNYADCIDSAYRNQSIYYQDLGEKVVAIQD